jgi:cytoplasmic iron level regulating protein YaaA (DUF328/UPF0246 family)
VRTIETTQSRGQLREGCKPRGCYLWKGVNLPSEPLPFAPAVASGDVQLLLPPSEAKTPGGRGRPLQARPAHPLLGAQRQRSLEALSRLVAGRPEAAAKALALPPKVAADALATNSVVMSSPTAPALRRYAGIVYDGLGYEDMPPDVARVAARSIFVFSGLFGVVRGDEHIPDYRVPAKATLPGVGVAGTTWRPVLDTAFASMLGRGLVLDLRSSDYQAMWRPVGALARRVVTLRVLSPLPAGGLGVVSYPSKYAKGRLAAALVTALAVGESIRTVEDIAEVWTSRTGHLAEVQDASTLTIHHPAKVVGVVGL